MTAKIDANRESDAFLLCYAFEVNFKPKPLLIASKPIAYALHLLFVLFIIVRKAFITLM